MIDSTSPTASTSVCSAFLSSAARAATQASSLPRLAHAVVWHQGSVVVVVVDGMVARLDVVEVSRCRAGCVTSMPSMRTSVGLDGDRAEDGVVGRSSRRPKRWS